MKITRTGGLGLNPAPDENSYSREGKVGVDKFERS